MQNINVMRSRTHNFQVIFLPILAVMLTLVINMFTGANEYAYLFCVVILAIPAAYFLITGFKKSVWSVSWKAPADKRQTGSDGPFKPAKEVAAGSSENSRSVSGDGRIDDLVKKITILMEEEKLYQETELTLHQLAGKLQVPTYLVSQALNEGMRKKFYDLVNAYRVEEAKRLLLDEKNRNYTILSVGFEAGFNSKTTFNTVFKKFTGLTPTEYRDKFKAASEAA